MKLIIIYNCGKNSKLDDIAKELRDRKVEKWIYQKYEMLEYLNIFKRMAEHFSRNYKREEFSNTGSTVNPA